MIGIYCIENQVNHKKYIGKSKIIENRALWINEATEDPEWLRNEHLTRSVQKYGINNFHVRVLEECDESLLNDREQYWIDYYNSANISFGYNKTYGGEGGNFTEEIKEKIGNTLREKYKEEPHYMLGFRHTEETKERMSASHKGKPSWILGTHLSEETKQKLSNIRSGRVWMTDGKDEVFIDADTQYDYELLGYKKGRIIKGTHYHPNGLSEETKQKLRESATGRKYTGRVYNLICKNCGNKFLGNSPKQRYCTICIN